ncbi:MAG: hypothetical protein CL878_02885 [Dehalococcoidia bacterium]|nr:hypothetical protein [Dehalococcoidia bacterium]
MGEDDPEAIHLDATANVEDLEEVVDVVIDRVVELQLEEELPIPRSVAVARRVVLQYTRQQYDGRDVHPSRATDHGC